MSVLYKAPHIYPFSFDSSPCCACTRQTDIEKCMDQSHWSLINVFRQMRRVPGIKLSQTTKHHEKEQPWKHDRKHDIPFRT